MMGYGQDIPLGLVQAAAEQRMILEVERKRKHMEQRETQALIRRLA